MILIEVVVMKDNVYVKQFFTEGFGRLLFLKPVSYLNGKINNRVVFNILTIIITVVYCLSMVYLACLIFNLTYPF